MATTDTYCKVSTCAFHHPQDRCAAGEIQVSGASSNAFCDTFLPRDEDGSPSSGNDKPRIESKTRRGPLADDDLNINMGSYTHMYEGYASNLTPMVGCTAEDCQHNEHGICFAEQIVIDGPQADSSPETNCDMYEPE
jgi:hypothetical protein